MAIKYETDDFPIIKARHFTKYTQGRRHVRLIVIHSMEAPEKGETAENVAKYFARGEVKASAHICLDNNSVVQSVLDNDIAYCAPGANHDGIHLELAGFAKQTTDEWLDGYGVDLLNNAAFVAAQYCLKYGIPPKQLTNEGLRNPKNKGIVSHAQVSAVFKRSTHTDPGPNFPWPFFLDLVEHYREARLKELEGKV